MLSGAVVSSKPSSSCFLSCSFFWINACVCSSLSYFSYLLFFFLRASSRSIASSWCSSALEPRSPVKSWSSNILSKSFLISSVVLLLSPDASWCLEFSFGFETCSVFAFGLGTASFEGDPSLEFYPEGFSGICLSVSIDLPSVTASLTFLSTAFYASSRLVLSDTLAYFFCEGSLLSSSGNISMLFNFA